GRPLGRRVTARHDEKMALRVAKSGQQTLLLSQQGQALTLGEGVVGVRRQSKPGPGAVRADQQTVFHVVQPVGGHLAISPWWSLHIRRRASRPVGRQTNTSAHRWRGSPTGRSRARTRGSVRRYRSWDNAHVCNRLLSASGCVEAQDASQGTTR